MKNELIELKMLKSENAYLRGKISAYKEFLISKGFIEKECHYEGGEENYGETVE